MQLLETLQHARYISVGMSSCGLQVITRMTGAVSDKDFGECICASTGDEGLGRVERHVVNGLVMFLPVGCDLLHTGPVIQHPQTH